MEDILILLFLFDEEESYEHKGRIHLRNLRDITDQFSWSKIFN